MKTILLDCEVIQISPVMYTKSDFKPCHLLHFSKEDKEFIEQNLGKKIKRIQIMIDEK